MEATLVTSAPDSPAALAAPPDWEAEIGGLLEQLSALQSELLDVLQQKRDALAAADVGRLGQLQSQAEQLAERLEQCHRRRGELLAAAGRAGLPSDNVGKLAARIAPGKSAKLGRQVKEAAGRMRLLQHHSLANWVLAQRSLLHVSQLLEIVATGGRMQPTYGDKESVHSRGALVDQDA